MKKLTFYVIVVALIALFFSSTSALADGGDNFPPPLPLATSMLPSSTQIQQPDNVFGEVRWDWLDNPYLTFVDFWENDNHPIPTQVFVFTESEHKYKAHYNIELRQWQVGFPFEYNKWSPLWISFQNDDKILYSGFLQYLISNSCLDWETNECWAVVEPMFFSPGHEMPLPGQPPSGYDWVLSVSTRTTKYEVVQDGEYWASTVVNPRWEFKALNALDVYPVRYVPIQLILHRPAKKTYLPVIFGRGFNIIPLPTPTPELTPIP